MSDGKTVLIKGKTPTARQFVAYMRRYNPHELHFYAYHPEVGPLLRPDEKLSENQKWLLPGG